MKTGRAVIDFGDTGTMMASLAISQPDITTDCVVQAWLVMRATGDHAADEHFAEDVKVIATEPTAGTGFTVWARTTDERPRTGAYSIAWRWEARTS